VASSISAVEASQPERLVSAAADVGARAGQLDSLIETQRRSMSELRTGWSGTAADAALARGERDLAKQESVRDKLRTLNSALESGGGQLGSTRTALLDMVNSLRGQGWQISDDGVATPPANLNEVFRSYPLAYTTMIQRLLQTFDSIDRDTAGKFPTFDPKSDAEPDVSFAVGDDRRKKDIEDLVRRALDGDQEAAAQVDGILGSIEPNQLQGRTDPNNPNATIPPAPLNPDQAEVISRMQNQMSGMSLDELVATKNKLGDHGDIIGDSMQVMSDPGVKFPLAVDDEFKDTLPPGLDPNSITGSKGALPQSVQDALDAQAVNREITDPNQTVPTTTYPSGDDLKKVAELIQSGDAEFQQGSELDRTIMDRAVDVLPGAEQENIDRSLNSNEEGDSIVQDIFNSAGRDKIVSHDLITAANSDFLDLVARHEWVDNSASVSTLTEWVHNDATSTDRDVALRAGETANALSTYLGQNGDNLLHLTHPTSIVTDGPITVGQMNPDLIQGWGDALEPYQNSMLGDGNLPGFHTVPGVEDSNFSQMKNIFAAIDSDHIAATDFNKAAFETILDYQKHPNNQNLGNAGGLLGVIDAAASQEASARGMNDYQQQLDTYNMKRAALGLALETTTATLPLGGDMTQELVTKGLLGDPPTPQSAAENVSTKTVTQALNETNYYIAQSLVGNDPNLGAMTPYVENGRLLSPDEVKQRYPDGLRNYYFVLDQYVADRGYENPMDTFYREYQSAGGINTPREEK
jgi:uncharacterized protein YukE